MIWSDMGIKISANVAFVLIGERHPGTAMIAWR
jgi:hypothetical protein